MKTEDAIKLAGSSKALAEMLGISAGAISQWGTDVPDAKQLLIERVTNGALKADIGCLDRVIGADKLLSVES